MSAPLEGWDAVAEASRSTFPDHLRSALLAHLTQHDAIYDGSRLRVGTDMKPSGEACDREIYYRVTGVPSDPPQIARRLRYERGRAAQKIFAEALRRVTPEVVEEVACRPLRPSAWAWGEGHGDVLDVAAKHLYEVKAPGIDAWRRARGMPQRLVREGYRYQLSYYLHELRRTGRADTASWIFLDMEGEFDPVEVPLSDDMLVPLAEIRAIEESKGAILYASEPPMRAPTTFEIVKVLKGGRRTKKNPTPERQVFAVERRYWGCSYCDHLGTCQPGPEETPVTLALDDPRRIAAVTEAEREWAAEDVTKKAAREDTEALATEPPTAPSAVAAPSRNVATPPGPVGGGRSDEAATGAVPQDGAGSLPSPPERIAPVAARASAMVVLSETLGPSVTSSFLGGRAHVLEPRSDGLASCSVCKGGEGSLPTECPGVAMNRSQQEGVYAGSLDFRGGRWVNVAPNGPAVAVYLDAKPLAAGETVRVEPDEKPPTKAERSEARSDYEANLREIEERASRGEGLNMTSDGPGTGW